LQRRRTKDDARAYSVKLAEDGIRVLATTAPVVARVDDMVLSVLPPHQRQQFLKDLSQIVAALTARDQSPPSIDRD